MRDGEVRTGKGIMGYGLGDTANRRGKTRSSKCGTLYERGTRNVERGTGKHARAMDAKKGNNKLREITNCTNGTNRSNGRGGKRLVDCTASSERAVLVAFDIFV